MNLLYNYYSYTSLVLIETTRMLHGSNMVYPMIIFATHKVYGTLYPLACRKLIIINSILNVIIESVLPGDRKSVV